MYLLPKENLIKNQFGLILPIAAMLLVSLTCTITIGAPIWLRQQDLMNTAMAQTIAAENLQNPNPSTNSDGVADMVRFGVNRMGVPYTIP